MTEKMKILIGYDGSDCADAALEDLKRAGLAEEAEVHVLSVADVFVPPPIREIDDTFPMSIPSGVKRAHERAARKLREAAVMAKRANEQIKTAFPKWDVKDEALADSPAWALVRKADEWKPDLIVMGAHGHSVLGGRLILGSISQRVVYEAQCSVRIARRRSSEDDAPIRILVGVDNSEGSNSAVDAVFRRMWPKGTQVRLLAVVDTVLAITPDPAEPAVMKWIETGNEENWDEVREVFQPLAEKLCGAGLDAAVMLRRGNPKDEVVTEAESWGADCIFVGAKGLRGVDRLLLGSVSSAVSARAHCSVEVVRPSKIDTEPRR